MNFLIKIEEAINKLIEKLLEKLKGLVPAFIYHFISMMTHFPSFTKEFLQKIIPKVKIFFLKFIGYFQHYITFVRGFIISAIMYLRSEEFKKADKTSLVLAPFKFSKQHPFKASAIVFTFLLFVSSSVVILKNTQKIIAGTSSLRKPASTTEVEEDLYLEFKNHKFEVAIGGGGGGGHGAAGGEAHEVELFLDIKIEARNSHDKEFLENMEEMLDDNIEALELPVTQLPLLPENQKSIEELMTKSLNEDFKHIGHENPIRRISIKQVLSGRPVYYRQAERMLQITDINLQIFLEDTHRNRQVWIDFSILASNRNIILFLTDHDAELKDQLTTNVEPVIPQLPLEEEGRLIIKDKIKAELNEYLQKNGVEGKILEIYIDYLMAT